jgi:signal transduction histidine kinase
MDSEKKQSMIHTYRQFMEIGLNSNDPGPLPKIIDERIFGFGTAIDEKCQGIKGVLELLEIQKEQSQGMDISWRIKPVIHYTTEDENTAVFADDVYLTIKTGEEAVEMYIRFSVILNYQDNQWKVIHWHGSKPEEVESEKDTWGIENWKQKAEELERLVAEKTADLVEKNRELEIEAALERIRAASLAMQDSSALSDIIYKLYGELTKLDAKLDRCFIMIVNPDNQGITWWMAGHEGLLAENGFFVQMNQHPSHLMYLDYCKKRKKKWTYLFEGKEKRDWDRFGFSKTELAKLPEPIKAFMAAAKKVHLSGSSDQFGSLVTGSFEPLPEEQQEIISRFAVAFNQAYVRFLDLKRAEAQAREAQIEAALERVRSRSMAMHRSAELRAVVDSLYGELKSLQINFDNALIQLIKDDTKDLHLWISTSDGLYNDMIHWPASDLQTFDLMYEARIAQSDVEISLSPDQINAFFEEYFSLPYVPQERRAAVAHVQYFSIFGTYQKNTCVFLMKYSPGDFSAYEKEIITRFSKVFEQTYTRFLDLQKAEAQAREAQIQLALERVRARTMAMQSSEELAEVSYLLNKQVVELGIPTRGCAFNIYNEHDSTEWFSNLEGTIPTYKTPRENIFLKYFEAGQRGETLWIEEFGGERIKEHYKYLATLAVTGKDGETIEADVTQVPEFQIDHVAYFKYGYLLFITLEPAPEAHDVFKRFSKEFEQTYTRFLDLQKAEAQAREARIEAALERVRSRTMAMHNSQEVGESVAILFEELVGLGVLGEDERCGIGIMLPGEKMEAWTAAKTNDSKSVLTIGHLDMSSHSLLKSAYQGWIEKKDFQQYTLQGEDLISYSKAIKSQPNYKIKLGNFLDAPRIIHSDFYFKEGCLYVFSKRDLSAESLNVYHRFAAVFGQTYRRYQDLQKAEAQAREAQIEAALERVRAQTMAMHSSEDVGKCVVKMFSELTALGVDEGTRFGIGILNHDNENNQLWTARKNGEEVNLHIGNIDMASHPLLKSARRAWKAQVPFHKYVLEGEDLLDYYRMLNNAPDYKIQIPIEKLPKKEIQHCFIFEHGFFYAFSPIEFQPELIHITKRFSSLFEQTYRRYLDLVKAEAQAREAQIQLSLERIRAKAMAMQHSDELSDFLTVVFEQFHVLNLHPVNSQLSLLDFENNRSIFRLTGKNGATLIATQEVDMDASPVWKQKVEDFKSGHPNDVDVLYIPYDMLPEIGEIFKDILAKLPEDERPLPDDYPNGQYIVEGAFKYGYLGYSASRPPSTEEKEITRRITYEFGNVYQRFLDLQQAEAQALEAIKRASVDRVRAEIASMRTTSDLERIQPLIWNELRILGVPFIRCGVFIMDQGKQEVQAFLSTPDGTSIAAFHLPYQATEQTRQIVSHWEQKQSYKDHMDEAAFAEFTRNLVEQGAMASTEKYVTENRPTDLYLHFLPFLQGMLYVGNDAPLKNEELQLVQNLAEAFSTAYARYEDFNKLEMAKSAVEAAMSELKATQAQLIQQEKLASLGQLTAGIAHEIKNPLNFVNNFSEVSMEMIEEVLEARSERREVRNKNQEPGDKNEEVERDESEEMEDEILEDIKANLEKIHEHGSRANGIVTSMLQHSRGGSGKKEPTDLNSLIKEYVNLSYHGMRAGKNPIDLEITLDLDSKVNQIPLIKEDFSRVLINLCNNAFDAMRMKTLQGLDTYHPKLTVRTKSEKDHILIEVADNGPGIPDDIKDKIMQPFFTTKKGTEGTGLGLSITHDIVKAHGGELEIETAINEGTNFTIRLNR